MTRFFDIKKIFAKVGIFSYNRILGDFSALFLFLKHKKVFIFQGFNH